MTQKKNFQGEEPTKWIPQFIQWLKRVSNPILRADDFLVDSILEGYITKIADGMIKSYNETKR